MAILSFTFLDKTLLQARIVAEQQDVLKV